MLKTCTCSFRVKAPMNHLNLAHKKAKYFDRLTTTSSFPVAHSDYYYSSTPLTPGLHYIFTDCFKSFVLSTIACLNWTSCSDITEKPVAVANNLLTVQRVWP